MKNQNTISSLDKWSFGILFGGVILSCFALIPFFPLSAEIVKGYFFTLGTTLSFIIFIIARVYEGSLSILRSRILIAAKILVLAVVLSSIFSSSFTLSFWGRGFEQDTAAFFISGFLALVLSSYYFAKKDRLVMLLSAFLGVNIFISLFTIVRLLFPKILSLGVLGAKTSVLPGTWNEAMLFFAFTALIAVSIIDLVKIKKGLLRVISFVSLGLSIVMLIIGNFLLAWVLFGAMLLILFIYTVTVENGNSTTLDTRMIPVTSLIVILLSIFFVAGHSNIGTFMPRVFNAEYTELRPSLDATYNIAKNSLKDNPILGIGPNQFSVAWAKFRPTEILGTSFWNTNFVSGSSAISTSAVTIGLIGFISWILLALAILIAAFKGLFTISKDKVQGNLKAISIVLVIYLLLLMFVYAPGILTNVLFWIFVGVMVAVGESEDSKYFNFSFIGNPKRNFIQLTAVLIVLIAGIAFMFIRTEQFLGRVSIVKASILFGNDGSAGEVESKLIQSNNYAARDDTFRALAQFYSSMLGKELSLLQGTENATDEEKAKLKSLWNSSEMSAVMAAKLEPNRVENWQFLGSFYLDAVAIGVQGSLDNAELAYKNSLNISPIDPGAYVALAEIAYRKSDVALGDEYISKALELDPTFSSALTLKEQLNKIKSTEENIPETEITATDEISETE
jgi:hypothetical protein